ncbi:YgaP-like transmembrane domain [Phytopseudomonas dryadis]|uniref:DUF2892 domain-containing protein n=1 Tax=Phytopseudomonas dryadis TaxID=2487520 RepID=A0A4Q9QV63_9GAMM|nr:MULTISPECIES: YgaP-like transmembrane domain [Pseudomonas]TBU86705.1 DUF2892 domain-containing protein [Pseudomonas dryadis]TBV05434.1 DUF2892 domain-containing protein [Pseudomonas dryadis]TBV18443.1 DUF2892 domain-containing protein [Pseudomonas sp. FRB 230]
MATFDDQSQRPTSNVQGWERALSIGSGIAMARTGLKRGGVIGLCRAAFGGLLLARGLSGHCRVKRVLDDARALRPEVDKAAATIERLEARVAAQVTSTAAANQGKNGV